MSELEESLKDLQFEQFKTEFLKRQEQFDLNGYKVYFRKEPLVGCFADITVNQEGLVATVRYSNEVDQDDNPVYSAKHEAIHLLLARLLDLAERRYVSEAELSEANEEAVRRLDKIIA